MFYKWNLHQVCKKEVKHSRFSLILDSRILVLEFLITIFLRQQEKLEVVESRPLVPVLAFRLCPLLLKVYFVTYNKQTDIKMNKIFASEELTV